MLSERCERDDVDGSLVGGRQYDRCCNPVVVGAQPVGCRHTPPVARRKAREVKVRHRSGEIISDAALVVQKLLGDDRAHRVTAPVLGPGMARTVSIEAGHRIDSARLEIATQYVALAHTAILASPQLR